MEVTDLAAHVRKEQKKGPSRRLRQKGFVPAVFTAVQPTTFFWR